MDERQMMFSITLYSDGTLHIDGRAKQEAIPYILRVIADATEQGMEFVDIPMN